MFVIYLHIVAFPNFSRQINCYDTHIVEESKIILFYSNQLCQSNRSTFFECGSRFQKVCQT